jgi:eukaryotic-like serine/threonine-protein kinase
MSQVIDKIGRYQIVGELGKGAMGVVYKATDPNIGRTVAIKTLHFELQGAESEEMLARFRNEARAAGVMNHGNVITVYDAGEQDGMFYIAMEFVAGQTLQDLLKRENALPLEVVTSIARQVCSGLEYAHARGIIHRDIKPANIMITADGTVKIMDFGIAKFGGTLMTTTGQVVGTPNYMSPEQVKDEAVDARTDVFSVGVLLYEMLTGSRPFSADNVASIIYKIVQESPAPPRDLLPSLPPGLNAVVMKALSKDPAGRFANCAEFSLAIQEYANFHDEARPPLPSSADRNNGAAAAGSRSTAGTTTRRTVKLDPALTGQFAAKPEAAPLVKGDDAPAMKTNAGVLPPPENSALSTKTGVGPTIAAIIILLVSASGFFIRLHRSAAPAIPPAVEAAATSTPAPVPATPEVDEQSPDQRAKNRSAGVSAPPIPRPSPTLGELQISSTPFGATVTIDNKIDRDWVTPFAAHKLKPGRHTLVFNMPNYRPQTRQVEVVAGTKLPLNVNMEMAQGFLALNSDPAGAEIYIDGRDSGQVTPSRIAVNAGEHRVAIRKEGFTPKVTYATVENGESFTFAPALVADKVSLVTVSSPSVNSTAAEQGGNPFRRLRRLFGKNGDGGQLQVQTLPKGAEIRLGSSPAPLKSPARLVVAPGTYTLTLSLPGYKPITRSVQIEKGKMVGVDEVFEPQ